MKVHTCTGACIQIHAFMTCTYTCMHIKTHAYASTCMYSCIHIQINADVSTHKCANATTHHVHACADAEDCEGTCNACINKFMHV